MIETRIKQVVLSGDTEPSVVSAAIAKVEPLQARLPKVLIVKSILARILHPLGMHYWVSWMTYDSSSDRLIEMGLTCRFCSAGRTT